jgi:hypothetical protein
LTFALAALALAALLASVAIVASSRVANGVAIAGIAGILWLAVALWLGSRAHVAPAVGVIALAALGANRASFALVPVESASLVAIALLAWWSIDERHPVVAEPGVDSTRAATSAALVLAAAGLAGLVVAMASVASAALVGPAVGAVGTASIAAVLWSIARWRRFEAEHRG